MQTGTMLIMVLFYTQYNICEGAVSNGFWIIKSLAAIKDSETRLEMMILEERACSHHPHWPGRGTPGHQWPGDGVVM